MAKSLKTAFKLLDDALRGALPMRLGRDYPAINAEVDSNAAVKKARVAFDKSEKAFNRASSKLALAKRRVTERIDKRAAKRNAKRIMAYKKLQDEVNSVKLKLSLGEADAEVVGKLLTKLQQAL